jgi:hypothetical protein
VNDVLPELFGEGERCCLEHSRARHYPAIPITMSAVAFRGSSAEVEARSLPFADSDAICADRSRRRVVEVRSGSGYIRGCTRYYNKVCKHGLEALQIDAER